MTTIIEKLKRVKAAIRQYFDDNKIVSELSNEFEPTIISLMDQVTDQFECDMNKYSGRRTVQFPMVFDIMLCPDDYNSLNQGIPGILPELIADFYGIIEKKRDGAKDSVVNATNKYWQFRYSACDFDKKENEIPHGKFITYALLYSDDIKKISLGGEKDERRTVTRQSVRDSRSSVMNTAFNPDVLRGGIFFSNNTIVFGYDPTLSQKLETIRGFRVDNPLASLTWHSKKTNLELKNLFLMKENTVTISGPSDTRTNNPSGILIIDDEVVEKDHVQIKYVKDNDMFFITAFSDGVKANGFPVSPSQGQNITWMDLPKKSTIIIKDDVKIEFLATSYSQK